MEKQADYLSWERPWFLILITLIGGYMNAYTYVTRNEALANMHTANMSRFGIHLALGNWNAAWIYFLPMCACILGAAFSEFLKKQILQKKIKGDWRKAALVLEAAALFLVGFVPLSSADLPVTLYISFFMGFQLCLFRSCLGVAHNTTICTGNLRNVGQKFYAALAKKDRQSTWNFCIFTALTFSFSLGAIPGTLLSLLLQEKSVWICSGALLLQACWMTHCERNLSHGPKPLND